MKNMYLLLALLMAATSCSLFRQGEKPAPGRNGNTGQVESPKPRPPVKDTIKVEIKPDPREDSLNRIYPLYLKDKYCIAVFLPLYLRNEDRDKKHRAQVKVAQEFYKGLLIAADTLKKCGMKLEVHVYDSEDPYASAWSFADTLKRIDADLIIGPLLDSRMNFIDSIARVQNRNQVSPFKSQDSCRSLPYYFESNASDRRIGEEAARLIKERYPRFKAILVNERSTAENAIARSFASRFRYDSLTVVNFAGQSAASFKPDFSFRDSNIIFIPSKNEVFVSGIKAQLRLDSTSKIMVGLMPWIYFKSMEGELWERMHVNLLTNYHVDYEEGSANGFIKNYRDRFIEEPSLWAFLAFDEVVFYGKMINQYGRYFQRYIEGNRTQMLHTTYQMKKDSCGGWQNNYVNILHFQDYELKKLE